MRNNKKTIIIKGNYHGILTLEQTASNRIAALFQPAYSSEEPIFLFSAPSAFFIYDAENKAPLETVIAAALGEDWHSRGQTSAFDWKYAFSLYMLSKKDLSSPPPSTVMPKTPEQNISPALEEKTPLQKEAVIVCPIVAPPVQVFPFPHIFLESRWYKHEYESMGKSWHYLTGEIYEKGILAATAVAVPGKFDYSPPPWLKGFSLYRTANDSSQGYWLKIMPI